MNPIDTARVAEIIVRSGTRSEYGSGYRISSRLILTVAHLLGNSGDPTCTILLGGGDSELPATPVWLGTGQDLALLRLDSVAEASSLDSVPPVALGRLPVGVGSVPFTGVGFPAYSQRPNSAERRGLQRRDSRQVNGFVQLGSNMKSGLLDLTFTTSPPAEKGPDGQDAWQGISGTALFTLTQDGSLLVGVQAHRLPAAGTGSAEAEPIAEALKDPEFARLLALNGVRPQALAVDPPGHDPKNLLQAVIPQQKLIEGFGDFKKNLTPERLPFVSPGNGHPAEPQNLFVQLVTSVDRGVLLVGAAGTGKSRTGIEVGQLALEAGWRVLHVLPGEDESITEQLAEQVVATPSAVLVVVDYLNESQLDLPALRHRLIPEAHRHGIQVALLACVRPGWLKKADRALLHELFDEVELRQDYEFQRLITDNALTTLAPTAIRRLGMPRMLAVCGHRPIVALLVAREIERRVVAGLSVPEATSLRSGGELSAWLESRLSEDGLTIPGREDTFTPARASHGLVAAAAATAACPQSRVEVTAAAHAALAGATGSAPQAEDVVATLVSLGWLEQDNGVLSVAHDVVADQFVESVILPEREGIPDGIGAHAMLAGCLTGPRTVGRFAVNIGRAVTDMALADRASLVSPVLDGWFAENAEGIGSVMRHDSDLGSYALGAICSGPPWSASAVQHWQQVVDPWLTDFGASANARHLLYRGLRHLPSDGALRLVPTALAWLKAHGRTRKAGYVLRTLLSRTDLPARAAQQTFIITLTWLDDHAATPEAGFVLAPLLSRTDLTPDNAQRAISTALTWLDDHAATPEARFVLDSLLSRTDLTPDNAQRAISTALTWLDDHAATPEAGFVLNPLLSRTDLTPDNAQRAISTALTWLDDHAATPEA
ncbi:trypsin-like peptidase domain-containing protein, partial [Streptomyces sp. NPDC005968]|uniref:trypsin-like peptidase domain-containing protein n=1 Tax=Streptomyces sp. NPDC005968 TaxID=3154574 RepID=UPI0033FADF6D